jgi:archaellum component FlaC
VGNLLSTLLLYNRAIDMEYIMAMTDIGGIAQHINEIDNEIKKIEQKITQITETLKEQYFKASSAMTENQNYLLSGIQTGPITKNYLLTAKGIEVVGEEKITSISVFLDDVIQLANEPNRKIEVIKQLVKYLQNINEMITNDSSASKI